MDDFFELLESFGDENIELPELSPIWNRFRVPRLPEKPQDPIIDSLQLSRSFASLAVAEGVSPIRKLDEQPLPIFNEEDLWHEVINCTDRAVNQSMSWDLLRKPHTQAPESSPFLSQQPVHVLIAARHILQKEFDDPNVHVIRATPRELLDCVSSMLTGLSSRLYIWTADSANFRLRHTDNSATARLAVAGLDYSTSESLVQRFLTIGSLMRRLETLVTGTWQSSSQVEPVIHAFTHAVSLVLSYLKANISDTVRTTLQQDSEDDMHVLTSLWVACAPFETHLEDVAELCDRGSSSTPPKFSSLPQSSPELLSAIYQKLEKQLHSSEVQDTCAISAFLLSSASVDYFDKICRSVGYSESSLEGETTISDQKRLSSFDNDDINDDVQVHVQDDHDDTLFPIFFPPTFCQMLIRSRKSLKLLRIAQPQHPLLKCADTSRAPIRWMWTDAAIEAAWQGFSPEMTHISRNYPDHGPGQSTQMNSADPDSNGLQEFARFDLEPGTGVFAQNQGLTQSPSLRNFAAFLASFPAKISSLTPSLANLADLVLSPLVSHVESLSTALVDIFLSGASGYLSFQRHMVLLRSYLLLTSPTFKSKLQAALFSNSPDGKDTRLLARHMTGNRRSESLNVSDTWVIGLASPLTESSHWPPTGADLSYLLRTVIVDSLDDEYPDRQMEKGLSSSEQRNASLIYQEADWRLGFAVRDLPVGSGQAKWLNPRSIEALDFLYMNYQPPHALAVLFPSPTLSKYHRLFIFSLRLLRVENVVKAMFRMSSPGSLPLFQTFTPSQKLFEHFRFMSSSFVTSLSSYIYDTAIGSNFDTFIDSLNIAASPSKDSLQFSDVFALVEGHSKLLDDVLSACLLRSSQKAVGELLRSILDVILEFGILMADLKRGALQEYEAVEPLRGLCTSYRKKMITFIRVLRSLVDKGTMSSQMTFEDMRLQILSGHNVRGVGVTANLYDLLVRLDATQWWVGLKRI